MREPEHRADSSHGSDALVLLCTVPDRATARSLAHLLLEKGAAACVNVVPGLESIYLWEGDVQTDQELLLVVKTGESAVEEAIALIEREHPYDCPEAIAVAIAHGSSPYLSWISETLRRSD